MTTSSAPGFQRRDVVLVNFVFSEETGSRRRPVVVLSSPEYQRGRQEVVVSAVTSNMMRILLGDYLLADWEAAGLPLPSMATGIIRTIKQDMVGRKLGQITEQDMSDIDRNLISTLGLEGDS